MRLKHFKQKLESEKEKLESEMVSVGRRNPSVPGDWESIPSETGMESDLADQADIVMGRESNTAILADLEARYDNILSALKKIENGAYGKCEVCGDKIEEARLEADPSATTCVKHL
ncbi:MAG: TraR/DksA C4-type zinc finger protein [Patescibacteria group bacterium]